jgi:hypothetical protein
VGEGGNTSEFLSVLPRNQGTAASFYRSTGGGLQSCRVALSATCSSVAYNVVELIVVLTNLASSGRRGGSCACLRAALRVVALGLLFGRCMYARFEGSADGRPGAAQRWVWRRPIDLGFHNVGDGPAVPRMAAQR